jgi:hypothetical protein
MIIPLFKGLCLFLSEGLPKNGKILQYSACESRVREIDETDQRRYFIGEPGPDNVTCHKCREALNLKPFN